MRDDGYYLFFAVQLLVAAGLITLILIWPHPWNLIRVAGLALTIVGLAFLFTARLQLGHSFSVSAQARKLVTQGLYAKIRNPIYVFGELVLVGVALSLEQPLLMLIALAVIPAQVMRARKEARVLEEKFGEEYRRYRAGTWF